MSSSDRWYVKTPDGDVEIMTLDEIDEAFNAGRIDENVMVLPGDGSRWTRLGEIAGLDSPAAPSPAFAGVPASLRPVSIHTEEDLEAPFARKKGRSAIAFGAVVAVVVVVGAGFVVKNSGLLRHASSGDDTASAAIGTAAAMATPPAPAPSPSPSPVIAAPPPPPAQPVVAAASTPSSSDDAKPPSKSAKGAKKKKAGSGRGVHK